MKMLISAQNEIDRQSQELTEMAMPATKMPNQRPHWPPRTTLPAARTSRIPQIRMIQPQVLRSE